MAKRNRSPVELYHDRVAGIYDTIYDGNPYWETVFEITWRHVKKWLPSDQRARCLDVGCGTGRWGLRLVKSGYHCDFLDISQKMLDQVGGKLRRQEKLCELISCIYDRPDPVALGESTLLFHASVDEMNAIPKASYDFIVGQGDPLNCAERPERALKEMARILRPGGILLMSVDNRYAGIFHYFKENDIAGLQHFLKTGKTCWVTDNETEQYEMTMFTPDGIRKMLDKRGLECCSLIGKTVLPLRRFRSLLENREERECLIRMEENLNSVEAMLGNAAHLEFAARKPSE